jgi:uncharacterized RDD family membrane protein YckC
MTAGGEGGADRPEWPREPADRSPYGQQPYEQQPYEQQPYEQQPYEQQPYEQRYPTDPLQYPQEHPGGYPADQPRGPSPGTRSTYPLPPGAYPGAPPAPYGQAYGGPVWYPPRPLASWGQRAGAYVIDSLLVAAVALVPGFILLIPAIAMASNEAAEPSSGVVLLSVLGIACIVIVGIAAQLWYFGSRQGETGTTVGKRMLGIRLVDMHTGLPIGKGRGLGRGAMRWALGAASVSIISLLWPLWDAKRQTWEDMVVKSVVVRDDLPA